MAGPATSKANGVLCSPATGVVTPILITGFGKAGVRTGDASAGLGVTGLSCGLVGGVTTLTFSRVYDNGVANYTQLNTTGLTRTQYVWRRGGGGGRA
jgi:hypothetical protein